MPDPDPLLTWLYGLKGPSLKWDLETSAAFVALCGRPDQQFAAIHIAGTNGKGSVAAMVHQLAVASGLTSGLFTSPHLVRPEERIRLGAEMIDSVFFRELILRLGRIADQGLRDQRLPRYPSFFEMLTAAAFLAFAEKKVDLGVVECGLGGRLDATNVIVPQLSVITTIGLDHIKTLGPTLAHIAREKAGIIKPRVPVLTGWIPPRALEVVVRRARESESVLHSASDELRIQARPDGTFHVKTPEREYRGLTCSLAGPHQRRNAALALRAAELLEASGLAFRPSCFAGGLSAVVWPGRMESIPGRPGFLLDGAHNAEGARALAAHLRGIDRRGRPRRVAVFGLTEGRAPALLLRPWASAVDQVILTRPGIDKAVDPHSIVQAVKEIVPACDVTEDPASALTRAAALAGPEGQVLVTGSLYLVGDARRLLLGLTGPGHPHRETILPPSSRSKDSTR